MLKPDDFHDDPYSHITNQAGHAAFVGIGLVLPLLFMGWPVWLAPVVVAVAYGLLWEWGWQRTTYPEQFDWRDSLMDTACVTAGASMVAGFVVMPDWTVNAYGLATGTACWAAWAVLVLWGGLRRWK